MKLRIAALCLAVLVSLLLAVVSGSLEVAGLSLAVLLMTVLAVYHAANITLAKDCF